MASRKRKGTTMPNAVNKVRRPMHCRSCDGAPLIRDCGCRKKTKTQGKVSTPDTSNESQDLALHDTISSPTQPYMAAISSSPPLAEVPIDPILLGIGGTPETPASAVSIPSASGPRSQTPLPAVADETDPTAEGIQDETHPPNEVLPVADNALSTTPEPPHETNPSSSTPLGKARASAENMIYGLIEGCYKGNEPYTFHRTAPLRDVIDDAADANTRYRRLIQNLALRAERMSIETGCWLFIAAAHPQGGQRMVTFSSEKLRQEGLTELNDIVNDFNTLISRMTVARRQSGMILQRNFEAEKQARLKAEAALEGMRTAVADGLSETERLRAELARFTQLRNLISMDNGGGEFEQSDDDTVDADTEAPI